MALGAAPPSVPDRQLVLQLAQQMADEIGRPFSEIRFNVVHGRVQSLLIEERWHVNDEEVVADAVRAVLPDLDVEGGVDESDNRA